MSSGDDKFTMFDASAVSILQSVFKESELENETSRGESCCKTASVKFMITHHDEQELRDLGYSQEQIDKFKPEEARIIIEAGVKAI